MTRYQYIVDFLTLRDAIAVQLLIMALLLLAPFGLARWLPWLRRGLAVYAGLLVTLVYGLAVAGVIHDLH